MRKFTARLGQIRREDVGMVTAEYAVGTVAACGFGGILYRLLTSESIIGQVTGLIVRGLTSIFS